MSGEEQNVKIEEWMGKAFADKFGETRWKAISAPYFYESQRPKLTKEEQQFWFGIKKFLFLNTKTLDKKQIQ